MRSGQLEGPGRRGVTGIWRRCRPGLRLALWLVALLLAALPDFVRAETIVRDVRVAPYGDGTRVVIDLNRRVSFRHITLDGPPRLAIDLPDVTWQVNGNRRPTDKLVTGFRFGRFRPGVSRVVFDIAKPFSIRRVFELPPNDKHGHRIVTDIVQAGVKPDRAINGTASKTTSSKAGKETTALVVAPPPARKPTPRRGKHTIVIDPGHGGIDPGAIGSNTGIYEKNIALAMGLELRRQLVATGRYKVVMTRDKDKVVRLRQRLDIARDSDGELFISLHADSLVKAPSVRGASVYTLSEKASSEEAARLAAKENRTDILAGVDLSGQDDIVTGILIDLAQRDAKNKAIQIAEYLVEELKTVTRLSRRKRSQAGFVVLKSPDMPSVLIELGYLSNLSDEKALADPAHLAKIAKAMVRAIDRYFAPGSS